jgi:glycine cleavage system H protein
MNFPEDLKYTESHEWIRVLEGGIWEIGITDYAQKELGDIVFVNLPREGDSLSEGASFADVESVKAVSNIYSPLNGTVKELNRRILEDPALINQSPYEAWLIRAGGEVPAGRFLSATEYRALLPQE